MKQEVAVDMREIKEEGMLNPRPKAESESSRSSKAKTKSDKEFKDYERTILSNSEDHTSQSDLFKCHPNLNN